MNASVTAVGFTGTQSGITHEQELAVAALLAHLRVSGARWFLHGCCIGADEEAAELARRLGYGLHGFPGSPVGDPKRARLTNDREEAVPSTKTPELTRNGWIVDRCDVLLATPSGRRELRRSGTWATIRRARAARRVLVIVWPDGTKNVEFAENFAGLVPENIPAPTPRPVS